MSEPTEHDATTCLEGYWKLEHDKVRRQLDVKDHEYAEVKAERDAALARVRELEEALPDPVKLHMLARWLDMKDRQEGRAGHEIQDDLRKWADRAEAILATPTKGEQ